MHGNYYPMYDTWALGKSYNGWDGDFADYREGSLFLWNRSGTCGGNAVLRRNHGRAGKPLQQICGIFVLSVLFGLLHIMRAELSLLSIIQLIIASSVVGISVWRRRLSPSCTKPANIEMEPSLFQYQSHDLKSYPLPVLEFLLP